MTYPEALDYIASLEPRGWRLGLDRMAEFARRAGLSDAISGQKPRFVHVAGTNGKGSVTAYLESLMVAGGARVGAFFSPYVVNPRERIQLGRELISEQLLAELATELRDVAESMEGTEFAGVTEFEFKTGVGFLAWQRAHCDWVALETGLGGRLDATNIVTPACSVIVSIGLDHQSILGDTVEQIAFEKAGIIKPNRPLVLGTVPAAAEEVIVDVAGKNNSTVWKFGREVRWTDRGIETPQGVVEGAVPGMQGVWQPHNLALAVAALQLAGMSMPDEAIRDGAQEAYAPGRYEKKAWNGVPVILDGAHNADSAIALAATLRKDLGEGAQVVLLTNMLLGHEPEAFYRPLAPLASSAVVPPIDFHRRREPAETVGILAAAGIEGSAAVSVSDALDMATQKKLPVVVTGSFYLVGEVARLLANG